MDIFILDDDVEMIRMATDLLTDRGFAVVSETDPTVALKKLEQRTSDLLLLDIRMPKMDGFEVCKRLKASEKTKNMPIVMISTLNTEADVVLGLELGADDYVTKPFKEREFFARLKAVLRRKEASVAHTVYQVGPFMLDVNLYKATLEGQPLQLNPKEFEMLTLFLQREGQVLTRSVISESVWKTDHNPNSRTIDTYVDNLRRKLGPYRVWIKSLKGVGYRFEAEE